MASSTLTTANLAGILYLARQQPGGDEELAEAARAFLDGLGKGPLSILSTPAWLSVNGSRVPGDAPGAALVNDQLLAHRVGKLEFRSPPATEDLLVLVRALSAYPGAYTCWDDLKQALGPVALKGYLTEERRGQEVIHLSEEPELTLTFGGSEEWRGAGLVDQGGLIPPAVHIPPQMARPEPPPRQEDPAKLERLTTSGRAAVEAADWQALLTIGHEFLDAQQDAASASSRRLYRLELRRLFSRSELTELAKLAAVGDRRQEAIKLLNALGADATEVLMALLADTEALAERRGYYSALTKMTEGVEVIIHHLDSPMWYVVRNAADLCGEMRLEAAVPELARQIEHADARVRKSIAGALSQIGSRESLDPLARMLKDPAKAVRLHVIGHLDGTTGRPLAMPLMALLQREEDPDVVREVFLALGRIGTPDALLALRGVATGEFKRFGRRQRVQAVEGLRQAGTAAIQVLTALAQQGDADLSQAAGQALAAVTI